MDTHFDLFQLPPRFALDASALDSAYRAVQSRIHPDRFASAGQAQKRIAMQWAARANEAYRTLKDPLRRAIYLLQLHGIDVQAETSTQMSSDFLMQQIEWRERIEEAQQARDVAALDTLLAELRAARDELFAALEPELDKPEQESAAVLARELLFIERVTEEIRTQLARIEDD